MNFILNLFLLIYLTKLKIKYKLIMLEDKDIKTAIIGGGASGLVCAIFSSQKGDDVTVFEKSERIGKKILMTGNGRCNLSNINLDYDKYNNPVFIKSIFEKFDNNKTIDFFNSLGALTYHDEEGRVYPVSDIASSVLDSLRFKIDSLGIKTILNTEVDKIEKKDDKFILYANNEKCYFDKVVIAFGNEKNNLLSNFGHKIIPYFPALVGLKTDKNDVKGLDGIRINCSVSYGNTVETGEVLFKSDGISGICVMNISSYFARKKISTGEIYLELLPKFKKEALIKEFERRIKNNAYLTSENLFVGIFHKNIGRIIFEKLGYKNLDFKIDKLSSEDLNKIVDLIKNYKVKVIGTYNNPQVISGGYDVTDFDENLMSKKISNLYACGEALDIDGLCGGYNLQWAFSSGRVCAL